MKFHPLKPDFTENRQLYETMCVSLCAQVQNGRRAERRRIGEHRRPRPGLAGWGACGIILFVFGCLFVVAIGAVVVTLIVCCCCCKGSKRPAQVEHADHMYAGPQGAMAYQQQPYYPAPEAQPLVQQPLAAQPVAADAQPQTYDHVYQTA